MRRLYKFAIIIFVLIVLPLLVLRLIPYAELKQYQGRSCGFQVLDRNGQVLRVFPADDGVKRDWVSLAEIPSGVIKVFLRAEDKRFYYHPGIDPLAIVSAALRNIFAGRTISGASTITMQLVRLIKGRPSNQSFKIKLIEAFDALRLEARLSKSEILELWINGIPFGGNIEGISAITYARYGIHITELDEARACLLAVIPRRPAFYDPTINSDAAVKAAVELAKRCAPAVNEADLREAAKQTGFNNPFYAPHFTDRAAKENSPVHKPLLTTLDLDLQLYAEELLSRELSLLQNNRVSNGAILAIDNADGSVIIYTGSRSWFDDLINGKIDGIKTENQPGSCIKPFLYALALEKGFNPNDILPDIPTIFGSGEAYSPANFNRRFNGPVRLRLALASSLNIPAVYMIQQLGVRNFEEFLVTLGFDSISHSMGSNGVGLALGNAGVSLEELVRAFSVFPNGGMLCELKYTFENEQINKRVISEENAWLIADILSDKGSRFVGFGAAPVFVTEFTSIFKTGTANQFQHIWALGASARYTVGVWMGNFSGETVVGRTGSSIPARITADLLNVLESANNSQSNAAGKNSFTRPPNLQLTEICSLSGMAATPACAGTLQEWTRTNIMPCTWHKGGLVYPPEYQSWLRERFRSGGVTRTGSGFIRIPVNGSIFYFDSSLPSDAQAIRIETAGFSSNALVYSDDILQGGVNQAGVFALPLRRGHHRITVEDEYGTAEVQIEVR
jgi:penicillin-binding protein 1C